MAKKTKLPSARIATEPRKKPRDLIEEKPAVPRFLPLDMDEREKLASFLTDPVFIKAWNNAEMVRPPLFPGLPEHFEGQHGDNRAAKTLCRLQGWEMHKAALIKQTIEPAKKARAAGPEFPESASLEAEVARNLPKTK